MSQKKEDPKKLKNTMMVVLMLPVLMCFAIGVVVMFGDTMHGLSLIGLSALIGVVNFLVVKVLFKKFSEPEEGS